MATLEKTIISPSEASGVAQAAFDSTNNALPFSKVFPMKSNDGKTTVTWTPVIPPTASDAMDHRAWDAEVGYGETVSQTAEQYTGLIPLSKKMHISERDLVHQVDNEKYLRDKTVEYAEQLGTEAAIRAELARISVAMNAQYTINAKNLHAKYTFERPSALDKLTPAKKWDDTTADALMDIEKWVDTIKKQHGRRPGAAFTTSAVIDALRTNEGFRTAASGSSLTNSKTRLSRQEVLDVLRSEANLTDVRMIDVLYTDLENEQGIVLPVDVNTLIPSSTFVMLPSFNDTNLGFTADGPAAENESAEYGINKTEADNHGLIACLLSDQAPISYDVYVNGSLMPILVQAVSTAKATVL